MADSLGDLPDDIARLKAIILAERAEKARLVDQNDRLLHMLRQLRRNHFGRKSEKLDDDQLNLGLEDLETAIASGEAAAEKADATLKASRIRERKVNRGHLPAHLPREEVVIEPPSTTCPCCGGDLHAIGEDRSERLDKIPAKYRVVVTRRPKYACRSCEKVGADETAGVIQASAPARLIEGGLPTEALVADVVVQKYAWHLPLYRQSQMMVADGIHIDRSTLAHWVGFAAFELMPIYDRLVANLKASTKLFADETRCPVLDPGRGKTKTGYLWAIARDDRPWTGPDPPAVAYMYAPGRGEVHAERHLAGFAGTLQVDGYVAYKKLGDPSRVGGPLRLANCWSHFRRLFYDIAKGGNAPIASEVLVRIAALYAIEEEIRGRSADERRAVRQARTKPLVDQLEVWLREQLARLSKSSTLAKGIRYGLNHWQGLSRFLDDGRIEIDSNTVERSMRPIALSRKNALFAGSDEGAANWAAIASLIETCKLNDVNPHAWLTDTLTKLVNRWPASRIDDLMPWAYAKADAA
ncbi:MAG TPA: IS66 family transposase [Hyphomicrobiaceae bacterium]|nr:IS66 family transposase [Hyphomicrobiaceae bacterium]